MDNEKTNTSVSFWENDECIWSVWLTEYPSYRAGDEIFLSVTQTPIGLQKFPKAERIQKSAVIEKVVHSIEQTVSDEFSTFLRLEVYIKTK